MQLSSLLAGSLQEYDPREMDRWTSLYDSIKENATSSIKDSMAAFRTIVDSGTDLGDTVKSFVDNLNDLPGKVRVIVVGRLMTKFAGKGGGKEEGVVGIYEIPRVS